MALLLRELTPPGRGGITVLSLRGRGAWDRVRRLVGGGTEPAPGELRLVRLRAGGAGGEELIDEALLWREGPERVELSLHGAPTVLRRLADELELPLETPAADGGSVESLEAEAERLLAHAPSEAAARVLLDQAEGALRAALDRLDPADSASFLAGIDALLARGRRAAFLFTPPVVVLAGAVNAGKSTLFNALLDRERVVVSETRGTTRDAVRERCLLGAWAVDLVDTAGEREGVAPDDPEHAGQLLGRQVRAQADLVVWLSRDPGAPLPRRGESSVATVRVTSAADRLTPEERERAPHPLAARDDPRGARGLVEVLVHDALRLPSEPWDSAAAVPFSATQRRMLKTARDAAGEKARRDALSHLTAR